MVTYYTAHGTTLPGDSIILENGKSMEELFCVNRAAHDLMPPCALTSSARYIALIMGPGEALDWQILTPFNPTEVHQ